jgi:hypothetical protein
MLRTATVAIAAICTIGLIGAPAAEAKPPALCTHSKVAYVTACATGGGGAGPIERVWDAAVGRYDFQRTKSGTVVG